MLFNQLNFDFCNCYLITDPQNKYALLVDPKYDYCEYYLKYLEEKDLKLSMVVDTHTHSDHISGCKKLSSLTGCIYAMHENSKCLCVTLNLKNNDKINLYGTKIKVLYTPGHTDDSICLLFDDKILTGDTLFTCFGIGRDDLPSSNISKHFESLNTIKSQPDYLIVCPAHEYYNCPISTLWFQKHNNKYLVENSKKEFLKLAKSQSEPEDWMIDVYNSNINCTSDSFDLSKIALQSQNPCETVFKMDEKNISFNNYISPKELNEAILNKDEIILIDVRDRYELVDEFPPIKNSVNIPLSDIPSRINALLPFKDKKIVLICRTGTRGIKAFGTLSSYGFTNVWVLEGGILAYYKEGLT